VPSSDAAALPRAVGLARVSSGGQYAAQVPEQALRLRVSFSNRYSVRPLPSTRMRPSFELPVETAAAATPAGLDEAVPRAISAVRVAAATAAAMRISVRFTRASFRSFRMRRRARGPPPRWSRLAGREL